MQTGESRIKLFHRRYPPQPRHDDFFSIQLQALLASRADETAEMIVGSEANPLPAPPAARYPGQSCGDSGSSVVFFLPRAIQ